MKLAAVCFADGRLRFKYCTVLHNKTAVHHQFTITQP
jgi:hypothetical protein